MIASESEGSLSVPQSYTVTLCIIINTQEQSHGWDQSIKCSGKSYLFILKCFVVRLFYECVIAMKFQAVQDH